MRTHSAQVTNLNTLLMKKSGCFGITLVLTCALNSSSAQTAEKPTMSVAKTQAAGVNQWQPSMGDGLAQMFITEFNKLNNCKVLESVALDDVRAEQGLGKSGEVADSESVKTGNWKGADYTFKSTVTRFGSTSSVTHIPGPIPIHISKTTNEVQIDWRIIDNATRDIVASGRGEGAEKGKSVNVIGVGTENREFMTSALGKATMKAISNIMDKVATLNLPPGKRGAVNQANADAAKQALRSIKGLVKLVEGKEIWVSLGTKSGFATGDKIKIYKPVEKKNTKGEVITTAYQEAAEIVLSKVQDAMSMGEYTGPAAISEDWAAADAGLDIEKLR
jgi:curli biogenesis system outer membrane secretion channel CsgG